MKQIYETGIYEIGMRQVYEIGTWYLSYTYKIGMRSK